MAISFRCPGCGAQHSVADDLAGRSAQCQCGATMQVPASTGATLTILPAAPGGAAPGAAPAVAPPAAAPPPTPIAPPRPAAAPRPASPAYPAPAAQAPPPDPNDPQQLIQREKGRRASRWIWFGILLIAIPFLPMMWVSGKGATADIPTFLVLKAEQAPAILKIVVAAPWALGLMAIVLGAALHNRIRGAILLAMWLVPVLLLAITKKDYGGGPLAPVLESWRGAALFLCVPLLLICARSRSYRPQYNWVYPICLVGLGALLAYLLVPMEMFGEKKMFLIAMIQTLGTDAGTSMKLQIVAYVAVIGLIAIAGLLGLFAFPGLRQGARSLAKGMSVLLVLAILLVILADLGFTAAQPEYWQADGTYGLNAAAALLNEMAKTAWLFGMSLFLALCVTDVIVGSPEKAAGSQPAGASA